MKKLTIIIAIFIATGISAQSKYQSGMQKAFGLWGQGKMTEASNLFERISKAEKENWLPSFYAGYTIVLSSFGVKDEATLKSKLEKAEAFLNEAALISPNNPEIMIIQALHNTAYIAYDGQKYGMTLSGKNSQIYAKAIALAPNNPRVILGNAEWNMGSAKFFGKSTKPYCDEIKRAIDLGKNEKNEVEFYPKFQVPRAEQVLKQCQQ
tara:strand:+ start:424 stop:1047 length:624 start_codon:yes stop_codon:yes gene_type:complete